MIKNYMQIKEQREAWVRETKETADGIKTAVFTELKKNHITVEGKRVVQLGCMWGHLVNGFLERAAHVHAVDFSPEMIALSRKELASKHKEITRYEITPIIRDFSTLSDLATNLVIAATLLKNLPEPMAERIIEDARRLIMPGGYLIFILPISEKHHTSVNYHKPHLDTVYWTKDELKDLAAKYRYHVIQIDTISIFQKL